LFSCFVVFAVTGTVAQVFLNPTLLLSLSAARAASLDGSAVHPGYLLLHQGGVQAEAEVADFPRGFGGPGLGCGVTP
jgi:hypothetical protein